MLKGSKQGKGAKENIVESKSLPHTLSPALLSFFLIISLWEQQAALHANPSSGSYKPVTQDTLHSHSSLSAFIRKTEIIIPTLRSRYKD